jgi:hypothetical protein
MYPWYRDSQLSVGQLCGPLPVATTTTATTIKTESGYGDCMLGLADIPAKVKTTGYAIMF